MWKLAFLSVLVGLSAAGVARAEVTKVCFDPGTSRLSPEGYHALRQLVAEQGGGLARRHIRLFTGGGKPDGLTGERLAEARMELVWNGLFYGRIEVVEGGEPVRGDCLDAEVSPPDSPPFMALWHFYGPYFERGSDEVAPEWRRALRFIVAGYAPGGIRYCIGGHSDTEADERTSMAISRRRADNVRLELVRQGVRWEDIEVRAYGETQLVRPTPDGVAEPLNRRVFVDVREACPATWR